MSNRVLPVGTTSSNGDRYETRLTSGNSRRGVRAEVAERCRLGSGPLRKMPLMPNGILYGASCRYGDASGRMGDCDAILAVCDVGGGGVDGELVVERRYGSYAFT